MTHKSETYVSGNLHPYSDREALHHAILCFLLLLLPLGTNINPLSVPWSDILSLSRTLNVRDHVSHSKHTRASLILSLGWKWGWNAPTKFKRHSQWFDLKYGPEIYRRTHTRAYNLHQISFTAMIVRYYLRTEMKPFNYRGFSTRT